MTSICYIKKSKKNIPTGSDRRSGSWTSFKSLLSGPLGLVARCVSNSCLSFGDDAIVLSTAGLLIPLGHRLPNKCPSLSALEMGSSYSCWRDSAFRRTWLFVTKSLQCQPCIVMVFPVLFCLQQRSATSFTARLASSPSLMFGSSVLQKANRVTQLRNLEVFEASFLAAVL